MNLKLIRLVLTLFLVFLLIPVNTLAASAPTASSPASGNSARGPAFNFPDMPDLKAPSAILLESERGQVLYEKNPDVRLHISTACKIMTVLIAIENSKLDSRVTISKESVEAEGSALSLEVGEKYSLEDLLYGVMLTSANDAANAIAEYVGGDIGKFVVMMNNKAAELNLKNTRFMNPTGLLDESQYTTAYDLALLIKYALRNPTLNRIFSVPARPWVGGDGKVKILTSQNKLFWSYDGMDGGKVGFNNKDQQTAVSTATKGNQRYISVILDSPEDSVMEDSEHLLDFGFSNYKSSVLVYKGSPQKTISIQGKELNLVSLNDVYYTHPVGESYIKSLECTVAKNLAPPIGMDKSIGLAKYVLNDNTVIEVNLYPDIEINPPEDLYSSIKKKIEENKEIFIFIVFLLAIEAILLLYNIYKLLRRFVRYIIVSAKK